jgi:hypothetical protein
VDFFKKNFRRDSLKEEFGGFNQEYIFTVSQMLEEGRAVDCALVLARD